VEPNKTTLVALYFI